jgi:hypothetical protein
VQTRFCWVKNNSRSPAVGQALPSRKNQAAVAVLDDRSEITPLHSRGAKRPSDAAVLAFDKEGAGNAGRAMRPQPRMQNKKAYERSHHGHTDNTRHSLRDGFTVSCVLFPVIGFVVTVAGGMSPPA